MPNLRKTDHQHERAHGRGAWSQQAKRKKVERLFYFSPMGGQFPATISRYNFPLGFPAVILTEL
jgi:hypothetical protein